MKPLSSRAFDYLDIRDQSLQHRDVLKELLGDKDADNYGNLRWLLGGSSTNETPEENVGFITKDNSIAKRMVQELEMDYVYDRISGFWFFDLRAYHEVLRAGLYDLHTGNESKRLKRDFKSADAFIEEGYGFFISSVGSFVLMSEDYVLTPEQKIILATEQIRRI